ncbi:DMT family transporter [Acidovorax sp. NCPPB 3576]|uniref:DMT family transporter n=1 Tax=Acidovorax sp. NCPPB 3576 TaxID=2940488 RepID=UPI00234B9428|nr:DMT family transporter [Acidovorax sp. NCPPB 3576]WCM90270.1 DMT family transporter [Acidovorax sp. NCPPB 3576]
MLTGILAGLAAGALWGLVFVAPRMAAGFASVDLTAGRFVAYGAMAVGMMLWSLRPGKRPPVRWPTVRQGGAALGLSVLGFTGYYLLLVLAIRDAGVEVPALIIGTIPVWVMLLGKPKGLRWAALVPGLALTLAGLALMAFAPHGEGGAAAIGGGVYWRGIGITLVALVFWTAFAILNSAWVQRHPEVGATQWANWLGVATGLGGLLLWVANGTPVAELAAHPGFGAFVLVCLAIGVGASWLATILWNVASQRLSASLCGQLIVSETLFALFYSFAWVGHWPAPVQWAACVMFTLGILATIQAHR